VNQEP